MKRGCRTRLGQAPDGTLPLQPAPPGHDGAGRGDQRRRAARERPGLGRACVLGDDRPGLAVEDHLHQLPGQRADQVVGRSVDLDGDDPGGRQGDAAGGLRPHVVTAQADRVVTGRRSGPRDGVAGEGLGLARRRHERGARHRRTHPGPALTGLQVDDEFEDALPGLEGHGGGGVEGHVPRSGRGEAEGLGHCTGRARRMPGRRTGRTARARCGTRRRTCRWPRPRRRHRQPSTRRPAAPRAAPRRRSSARCSRRRPGRTRTPGSGWRSR